MLRCNCPIRCAWFANNQWFVSRINSCRTCLQYDTIMEGRSIFTIFQSCVAIGLCIVFLALRMWGCGGLIPNCEDQAPLVIVVCLIIGGLSVFGLVSLIDLCRALNNSTAPTPCYNALKILFAAIGAGCLLAGNLLYAIKYVESPSFLMSFAGSIIAIQVVLISFLSCNCMEVKNWREASTRLHGRVLQFQFLSMIYLWVTPILANSLFPLVT